jgi:hypothetical protein
MHTPKHSTKEIPLATGQDEVEGSGTSRSLFSCVRGGVNKRKGPRFWPEPLGLQQDVGFD